jgi:hypothetical protein
MPRPMRHAPAFALARTLIHIGYHALLFAEVLKQLSAMRTAVHQLVHQQEDTKKMIIKLHQDTKKLIIKQSERQVELMQHLFLQPTVINGGSKREKYRKEAISHYQLLDENRPGMLRCMVTGDWYNENKVTAGHIYRKQWPKHFLVRSHPTCPACCARLPE